MRGVFLIAGRELGGQARFLHVNGGCREVFQIPSEALPGDGFAFVFRLRTHPHANGFGRILVGGLQVRAPAAPHPQV